jgi:hypothetical protein
MPERIFREHLCAALFIMIGWGQVAAQAQDSTDSKDSTPLQVSIGAVRTAAERSAVAFAIDLTKNLNGVDFQSNTNHSLVYFTPDIQIQTGEGDAFDGIVAKVTGSLVVFRDTTIAGLKTPNTTRFSAFPFSAGIETDRRFDAINTMVEAGWVPWFQGVVPGFLKSTFVGLFLQAGYKADVGTSSEPTVPGGGNLDESDEDLDSGLLRAKGSVKFAPTFTLGAKGELTLGIVGAASVWYDLAHGATYHRIDAKAKVGLGKDKTFEFGYQDGSGAPNFNEGDQFGAFLVVAF